MNSNSRAFCRLAMLAQIFFTSNVAEAGWHAECHDPRTIIRTVDEFRTDSLRGVFCGPSANDLGLKDGLNESSCRRLGGQLSVENGFCKIIIYFNELVDHAPLFCLGIVERGPIVWMLLTERTGPGGDAIFNYEWKLIGHERCRIYKGGHDVAEGLTSCVQGEQIGSGRDEPAALRSTRSLQELYLASWSKLFHMHSSLAWQCLIHPKDD